MEQQASSSTVSMTTLVIIVIVAFAAGRVYQNKIKPGSKPADSLQIPGISKLRVIHVFLVAAASVVILWFIFLSTHHITDTDEVTNMNGITLSIHHPNDQTQNHRLQHNSLFIDGIRHGNTNTSNRQNRQRGRGDYPWGHIYDARVWCSVLTMWPERKQNIEVWC